jgi:aminoglycoside phosphotransferase (APT) family kinase protein
VTGDQLESSESVRLRSPAHGFCDDDETRRLLRSRPPAQALAWVGRYLGARVTSARAMRGGMSSAVHLLTAELPRGGSVQAILRRYVRPELNEDEPDIASQEAEVLRFVEPLDVPTPRLLAVDPTGDEAGAPALLMSRLSGRVDWWSTDADRWLRALAEILPRIHASPLPAPPGVIRPFAAYKQNSYEPPSWARHPAVWEEAIEIFHGPAPDEPAVFIQRDFHPGNVLGRYGKVSGVVDWQAASIGPAALDVAHCRANLLGYGPGCRAFHGAVGTGKRRRLSPLGRRNHRHRLPRRPARQLGIRTSPRRGPVGPGCGRTPQKALTRYLGTGFTLLACVVHRWPPKPG